MKGYQTVDDKWAAISAIGTFIGAISTSLVVIIALFQNKKIYSDNVKIDFLPNHRYFDELSPYNEKDIIGINVCNMGINDLYVDMSGISFKRDSKKSKDFSILFANPITGKYSEAIKRGQTQTYIYTYESISNEIKTKIKEGLIKENQHIFVFVITTTQTFWIRTTYNVEKLVNLNQTKL
jgi:predicted transcriptional regulator